MHDNNNKNVDIELMLRVFAKGYQLGNSDCKEGIHIDFNEIQKLCLNELNEFFVGNNSNSQVALTQ